MHLAKCVQEGQDVIAYDKDGRTRFIVRGEFVEHAPRWLAVRKGDVVILYDEEGLLRETRALKEWETGARPVF